MRNRNQEAIKGLIIFVACAAYVLGVAFGDIMFLTTMQRAFPNGFLGALAMVGAVTTGITALTLPAAKHWWFYPGKQMVLGIAFWLIDLTVLVLNAMLAYEAATGKIDNVLAAWQMFSPASPLVGVFGWGIMFLCDPSHQMRQAEQELGLAQSETYTRYMIEATKSQAVHDAIHQGAVNAAWEYAHRMTGQMITGNSTPSPAPNRTIDAGHAPQLPRPQKQGILSKLSDTLFGNQDEQTVSLPQTGNIAPPTDDEEDNAPTVYEQPVRKRPAEGVGELRDALKEQVHTQAALQVKMEQMLKERGMTEEEIEHEMNQFHDQVTKRRESKK